jgi:hypothetical protein
MKRKSAAQAYLDKDEMEAARVELDEAKAGFWAAESDLGDLGLMLLRFAAKHQRDALRDLIAEVLRGEFRDLVQAIAGERRGRRG